MQNSSELSSSNTGTGDDGFSFDNLANHNEERKLDHEKKIKRNEMESVVSEQKYGR